MEFRPEQRVVSELFGNNIKYVIPGYQRPYSWDCIGKSDKNNQVNVMWQDLIAYFEEENTHAYFLGSMVLVENGENRKYEVVDGQQRLTTLTILFVAVKCFMNEVRKEGRLAPENQKELDFFITEASNVIDGLLYNRKILGLIELERKIKIERLGGFDYDKVLQSVTERNNISAINLRDATEEQKTVAERYFKNLRYFMDCLKETFTSNGVFSFRDADRLNKFVDFLNNRVTVVRMLTSKFDEAYHVFEVLNNRGLPLSNKDLFRNFIINEFQLLIENNAKIDPNKKWLELDEDIDAEFIGRYVESTNAKNLRYSAFNDLREIYKTSFHATLKRNKIEIFFDDIKKSAEIYSNIANASFEDKRIRNSVLFLMNAGNTRYSLNLLIAVFRNLREESDILNILKAYERHIVFLLLGPSQRFSTVPIYQAIGRLNEGKFDEALHQFELTKPDKKALADLLDTPIRDNDTAKVMIARYWWAGDAAKPDDVVEQNLDFNRATLEHILPQNPNPATNWLKDFSSAFRKDFTYKLGNMTLLTHKMNSAARNFDFNVKQKTYEQTKLAMTQELANLPDIHEKFFRERHQKIVSAILKDLEL